MSDSWERVRPLFWNTDPELLDGPAAADIVIRTVLPRGDTEQVRWLFRRYGAGRIRDVVIADALTVRELPEMDRRLWLATLAPGFVDNPPRSPAERWRGRRRIPAEPGTPQP